MHVNTLPYEILSEILSIAAEINEKDGVVYTFGLSQAPLPAPQVAKLQRYIRGPVCPEILKWDSCSPMRQVCSLWHEWALETAMKEVYVRRWKGGERWAEIPESRDSYEAYELIDHHSNCYVYKDPFCSLRKTIKLLTECPSVAANVQRIWFNGFYTANITPQLLRAVKCCPDLKKATLPWTTVRHCSADEWVGALRPRDDAPGVETLEFLSVDLKKSQFNDPSNQLDLHPFESPLINFSGIRRLKLFGNTSFMPINDGDLKAIARTATNLEELYITCMSTITIEGVMALVKASSNTLRVLEHAPRSQDGFFHPHPGSPTDDEHLCEVLTSCPKLELVSISLPSVCETLFSNTDVKWHSDFQVRAAHLCSPHQIAGSSTGKSSRSSSSSSTSKPTPPSGPDKLQRLLVSARELQASRPRHVDLPMEIFFADAIFEPQAQSVHGDFAAPEVQSGGLWPPVHSRSLSGKGPYGSTGLYGKDEEGVFEKVPEEEYMRAVRRAWVSSNNWDE